MNQCLNGGTCISENGFTGPTFSGPGISTRTLCLCPPFYEGARCEIVTDKNITLTGSRDFVIIIIFAIASLLSKFFYFLMHVYQLILSSFYGKATVFLNQSLSKGRVQNLLIWIIFYKNLGLMGLIKLKLEFFPCKISYNSKMLDIKDRLFSFGTLYQYWSC